jgi:hypothetical protein
VTDSEGGSGTYDYVADTLDFTLVFPEVTYVYAEGVFSDESTVSGTCKRYQDASNTFSGTWKATRVTSGAAGISSGSPQGKNRSR